MDKFIVLLIFVAAVVVALNPDTLHAIPGVRALDAEIEREIEVERQMQRQTAPAPREHASSWLERARADIAEMGRDSREMQRHLFLQRQGLVPSGVPEIDEATRAAAQIENMMDRRLTPRYWRDRIDAGEKWVSGGAQKPAEKRVAASEAVPPAWAGKPAGVTQAEREQGVGAGRAMRRFVLGREEADKL